MEALLQVLHYWRDDAGHGTATTISEIQAHFSLSQLLRLAPRRQHYMRAARHGEAALRAVVAAK
jgi:hypothetical protein